MAVHLFELKRTRFVLWKPQDTNPAPKLVIGQFESGNPPTLANRQEFPLSLLAGLSDVWAIDASQCHLTEAQVYHYWFEVADSSPTRNGKQILCTDPTAFSVDWRLLAPRLPSPYSANDQDPAAVTKFENGQLVPCDPTGEVVQPPTSIASAKSAPNNRMVIYELPTSWSRLNIHGDPEVGVGTFRDVMALIDANSDAANFSDVAALQPGRSHLGELGVNALQLLPIADSFVNREWGYATSNYFAPDFDLGFPDGNSSPTANADLVKLVELCHERGVRFIIDVVMAFATRASLENTSFHAYHLNAAANPNDPDANQSGNQGRRMDFGGKLWRYAHFQNTYDPLKGTVANICPARQLMKAYLLRWMADFGVDGIRMDSVNNVANWDFVQEFKDLARTTWTATGGAADKFIVVGEELSVPKDLVTQERLDGLWNDDFKRMVRYAIEGRNDEKEPSFEWTVRKMIDCRLIGFRDGSEAINYVGSHDVENDARSLRLFNLLVNDGIWQTEERIKLAFVCLLTAVGIPMILAGDEFADQHDLSVHHPPKQRDAVNYGRLNDPFRRRIFDYVCRLVQFRTRSDALAVNDTDFIHVDFNDGKRVLAWRRGLEGSHDQVVVVANFSDFITQSALNGGEYFVPNWPVTPQGKRWREVTQNRDIPTDRIGREPVFPWEAKVYALV